MIFFELSETKGRYYAKGYRGKEPKKPYAYYAFRTEESRQKWMDEEERVYAEREQRKAMRKEAKKEARRTLENPYRIGDLLHYSWGYEQTNCEFFQVVALTAKTVTIRAIGATSVPRTGGFMSEKLGPVPDAFLENSKPLKKSLQVYVDYEGKPGQPYIKMPHGAISKCNPEDSFYSSYYA
jgi:hypothetical protein